MITWLFLCVYGAQDNRAQWVVVLGPGRPRGGGRLVRQPRRLPEAIEPEQVSAFLADLSTSRDRAIVLAMVLGGLRATEVRGGPRAR